MFCINISNLRSDQTEDEKFPIKTLKQPNWKVEGGLQHDFEYKSKNAHFKFLWNPKLDRSLDEISNEIDILKPSIVVFGSGLWFLADNKDFDAFSNRLKIYTDSLHYLGNTKVCYKITQPSITVIIHLQCILGI